MLDIWDTVLDMLDVWDMLPDTDMLDTQDMPVTDMQDTHGVSLPTPTVPSSQLNPLMSSLPAPNTWLPMLKKRTI